MGFFSNLFGGEKSDGNSDENVEVNDILNALENHIAEYERLNGKKPKTLFIDSNINMKLGFSGVFNTKRYQDIVGDIEVQSRRNIEGSNLAWKAY